MDTLSTRGKNIEYHAAFWHWIDRIVRVFGSMAMVPIVRIFEVRLITCPLGLRWRDYWEFVDAMRRSYDAWLPSR